MELTVTPHESLTLRQSDSDRLEVEVSYGPGGSAPPAHFHPSQDEHFEVHAGELHARLGGRRTRAGAGRHARYPARHGAPDVEPGRRRRAGHLGHHPGRPDARLVPAIDALHREGRVGKNGMPGPLAFGVLLTEYDDVFRLAAQPRPLIRVALAGARSRRATARLLLPAAAAEPV